MRIPCPHCGERDVGEFAYYGDATKRRPDGASDLEAFFEYVYPRDNPAGPHRELWYHLGGCRAWLVVNRDTRTHEIFGVERAREGRGERTQEAGAGAA
jgi:heterotetrameric sarcosine oxidase delta subunit